MAVTATLLIVARPATVVPTNKPMAVAAKAAPAISVPRKKTRKAQEEGPKLLMMPQACHQKEITADTIPMDKLDTSLNSICITKFTMVSSLDIDHRMPTNTEGKEKGGVKKRWS